MTPEDLDRMWADPKNWSTLGLYRCAEDPRRVVPKRIKSMGWTINTAHASSFFLFIIIGLLALVPPTIVVFKLGQTPGRMAAAAVISGIIVCSACAYSSSKR